MKIIAKQPLTIACSYLWIGFVCAISLLETWINTRSIGSTTDAELGRIVFLYVNKIEWVLAASILLNIIFYKHLTGLFSYLLFSAVLIILACQTFWLLPELRERVLNHVHGENLRPTYLHIYYITGDIVKCVCLLLFSFTMFRQID